VLSVLKVRVITNWGKLILKSRKCFFKIRYSATVHVKVLPLNLSQKLKKTTKYSRQHIWSGTLSKYLRSTNLETSANFSAISTKGSGSFLTGQLHSEGNPNGFFPRLAGLKNLSQFSSIPSGECRNGTVKQCTMVSQRFVTRIIILQHSLLCYIGSQVAISS
jgi:hypothetical protein